ncbi:MAG: hypothetical protein ACP5NW_04560 [Candidatus Woesearchaeota archaeon]
MRFTKEMIEVQKSPEYKAAYRIFVSILKKEEPDINALSYLYGRDVADYIKFDILDFYTDQGFKPGILRMHEPGAPTILSDMRKLVDHDDDFRAMDGYFKWQIKRTESIDYLTKEVISNVGRHIDNKFGQYSENVINACALTMYHKEKRKCGISSLCHYVGDAGTVYYLENTDNIPRHEDPFFRATVAFFHDFIEDFSTKIRHHDGMPYGLYRTDELARDYLPQNDNIIKDVKLLTNIYSQMLKHAFYTIVEKQEKVFTQERFRTFLEDYISKNPDSGSSTYKIHHNMLDLISSKDYPGISGKKLLEEIHWDTYEYYVRRLCVKSKATGDDTPIIVKFGDQNYNFLGKDALSDDDQEKLILKSWMWPSEVYRNDIKMPHIDNFVMELLEDSLCYSEYHVVKNLINLEAPRLFYESAFQKIMKLSPIFYKDRRIHPETV